VFFFGAARIRSLVVENLAVAAKLLASRPVGGAWDHATTVVAKDS
jgi:hypothetical protein